MENRIDIRFASALSDSNSNSNSYFLLNRREPLSILETSYDGGVFPRVSTCSFVRLAGFCSALAWFTHVHDCNYDLWRAGSVSKEMVRTPPQIS